MDVGDLVRETSTGRVGYVVGLEACDTETGNFHVWVQLLRGEWDTRGLTDEIIGLDESALEWPVTFAGPLEVDTQVNAALGFDLSTDEEFESL